MGIFGDIGKVILGGVVGGTAGAVSVFTVNHGADVLEGVIDAARQIVKLGSDVYKAIPAKAMALGGAPLHGLLKHVAEDEIILLGQMAANFAIASPLSWPALGPIAATRDILQAAVPLYVTTGGLTGKVHHRLLNDIEWEMAQYIFHDTLLDRSQIVLTNLGNPLDNGNPFVFPSTIGAVYVNMGAHYTHAEDFPIPNAPVLFHELTHVWQLKQRLLSEIFIYDARVQVTKDDPYNFVPGKQWRRYNLEQQAGIVEAWARGATSRNPTFDNGARLKLSVGSPVFRYINANIRRGKPKAATTNSQSARDVLKDGGHRTMRAMLHSPRPGIWWS